MVWNGGMSFHGGLIGVIIASQVFSSKHKVNQFVFLDLVVTSLHQLEFFLVELQTL